MAMFLIIAQLLVVLAMIFIGAKVGSIGLGIYGMVGVFILVFCFGLEPGVIPVDVMLIIVSVITASAALQAAGGLDYMVSIAAKLLKRHPSRITFYAPFVTWLFCFLAGTAHTCYALLPIISEIAYKEKVRPERPLSVSTIAASLGITGSPVSAATAAILSSTMLGGAGIGIKEIMIITVPASLIAIFVAALVQNFVGKPLEQDPEYQRRVREGLIEDVETNPVTHNPSPVTLNPRAKWAVLAFLLGVVLVVLFGSIPAMRPSFHGEPMNMNYIIEIIMMSIAALILFVGKADVRVAVKGNVFASGMNAMVSIFGVAWMGSTFFLGNQEVIMGSVAGIFTSWPILFAIPLFLFSIMLFSQAATAKTLYPVGLALGVPPHILLALFPAVNGYFFLPNYPTEVAAIGFDRTGTTHIGKFVINHSFQLAGFITTFVSIGIGYLIAWLVFG
ncbi:MAG: anaerobic C4-dicarboxylate transporter [Paludibacteraceae bacterium]|nr:anaerobic C4-dicarboxylate transporter [Paludibacteraceae bacterium]